MLEQYLKHEEARNAKGIPALPLNAEQTKDLCDLLQNPIQGKEDFLLHLFTERIAPGVDDSTKVKAEFLGQILKNEVSTPLIDKKKAIEILGTMMGGYNVQVLVEALQNEELAMDAAEALKGIILVYDAFETVAELSKTNTAAKSVIESWANAEWFTSREELPEEIKLKVYKVEGEINTDDFSPASQAFTRPDIPLHALAMGAGRFEDGIDTIAGWRKEGHKVAFVGDVVGTGSSRKSAANSLLWHIGEDIPCVPNKRTAGVVIGGAIAPIFYNTTQDSGGLPITTDVSVLNTGDEIIINNVKGEITRDGEVISTYTLAPDTLTDEYRAGGRIPLIIGKALTEKARTLLGMPAADIFKVANNPQPKPNQGYTMAQKIVGKACGVEGVLPGTSCAPKMTTVGSQDTTGPMTRDEIKELACLKFEAPMFMQSFCHTAAYPKATDVAMHKSMPKFMADRKGVPLKQGDGVIHSWLNRLLVPDTVGTGGDSHTRFPLGISFPAGSGLVAFAGALGFMPLDMPESVLVKFKGKLNPGITLRDVVNAIPYFAIQNGQLTVPKKNKINIFNGKIIEMEGLEDITVEQAFELTDATAERSAAAGCIKLSEERVVEYVKSNVALMESMIKMGYEDAQTIQNRIDACNEWLANPTLIERDENAEYAATIEIDLAEITEPILCCPNDPDDVKLLSEVANTEIQDVFIGSCMTNIGHFRACEKVWKGSTPSDKVRTYMAPPTRMDAAVLKEEATFSTFSQLGVRVETPGCSLCMGNQLRVPDNSTVFSTSTRNFNNRMGTGAKVYLGSAELGAVVSVMGKLPTPAEYMEMYKEKIQEHEAEVYKYMQFDEMDMEDALYQRRDQ
ncbi:bifunctional aconitate hydratase 2/2-methylisocitrate dehydratase [Marinifilum sp. D714]|uniref:bifunctional aconitate hydratase 2/2-methylisocitrate dehydratase n=1 Tax=Marinifilum sp. D714 TaxID=2937523 RepID=UPI0027D057A7|nr:bifunctional aconitate hydratase 2/2-methylisocitrate dehydratase [Marinifilum sp. D714]MDQ2178210.1 bifunctional aconitate hydratase 2/2-methylisocitrate dehydratase [Marinifilum sp. D714]